MEATVIIDTQVFENYNVGPKGINTYGDGQPQWKPKGCFQFKVELDSTDLLYMEAEDIKAVLRQMLAEQCSELERFELIKYTVQFDKPFQLSTENFMNKLKSLHNQKA